MTRSILTLVLIITTATLLACCSKSVPYDGGPVMKQRHIRKTFTPILEFLEVKPGIHFADVGAGNGALTVMMSTLMEDATVYIQDIDTKTLTQHNLDKIIAHYSRKSRHDLKSKNRYELVIGDLQHTNLPTGKIDLIYSNATIHVFDSPNEMLQDIRTKLTPRGRVFFRDSFRNDNGEGEFCSDKTCAKRLLSIPEFLTLMDKNGFKLVKQSPNMSGYPVFGFELAE